MWKLNRETWASMAELGMAIAIALQLQQPKINIIPKADSWQQ